ncbi:MAG: hypothetical protein LBF22_02355 [Deltaproteobacteria bacterium]|jgi:hypothetical protein|nr:hypothetical protein [Deltaproteobacteria bacterium]
MFVSSDFLSYLNRKKDIEKKSRPLVTAANKTAPGAKEKAPPVEQKTERDHQRKDGEVDYLNERSSTLNVIL